MRFYLINDGPRLSTVQSTQKHEESFTERDNVALIRGTTYVRRKYLGSEKVFHDPNSFGNADLTYWSPNYVSVCVIRDRLALFNDNI